MTACSHRWGLTWSTDTTFPTSLNQYDSGLRTFTCSSTQWKAQVSSTPTAYATLAAGKALPRLPQRRERLSKHDTWEPWTETQHLVQHHPAQHGRHAQEAAKALRDCELQGSGSQALTAVPRLGPMAGLPSGLPSVAFAPRGWDFCPSTAFCPSGASLQPSSACEPLKCACHLWAMTPNTQPGCPRLAAWEYCGMGDFATLELQSEAPSLTQQPVHPLHIWIRMGMLMLWSAMRGLREVLRSDRHCSCEAWLTPAQVPLPACFCLQGRLSHPCQPEFGVCCAAQV